MGEWQVSHYLVHFLNFHTFISSLLVFSKNYCFHMQFLFACSWKKFSLIREFYQFHMISFNSELGVNMLELFIKRTIEHIEPKDIAGCQKTCLCFST